MGSHFQSIVDVEATATEADDLADSMLAWLVKTGVIGSLGEVTRNEVSVEGLVVTTRRTVFHSMADDGGLTCPHCRNVVLMEFAPGGGPVAAWEQILEAVGEWHEGGSGVRPCPGCGAGIGLNDWTWSPPWGFGHLGFTFWNWDEPLSPGFIAEFGLRLGHRTVHPYGEI